MTLRAALNTASRILGDAGCREPVTDAELLLMHITGLKRHELHLNGTGDLPPDRAEAYSALVASRAARIPLQHLTGEAWFMGRRFLCGPGALVPRQDTESMLEAFTAALPPGPVRILDAGTGAGVIGITIALDNPGCFVVGADLSADALGLAARNIALHGAGNMTLARCDLCGAFRGGFDGIAANLPYIASDVIPSLEPEVRLFDPPAALDGGEDGMGVIKRMIDEAPGMLLRGGVLGLEASGSQPEEIAGLMRRSGDWRDVVTGVDLAGRPRWVVAGRR